MKRKFESEENIEQRLRKVINKLQKEIRFSRKATPGPWLKQHFDIVDLDGNTIFETRQHGKFEEDADFLNCYPEREISLREVLIECAEVFTRMYYGIYAGTQYPEDVHSEITRDAERMMRLIAERL